MSDANTFRMGDQVELWNDGAVRIWTVRIEGGLRVWRTSDVDGCKARSVDLPEEALGRLIMLALPNNGWQQALEVVAAINELRDWEGAQVSILCDDPEALDSAEQTGVEVSDDWTGWLSRRFLARTWQDAAVAAAQAKREQNERDHNGGYTLSEEAAQEVVDPVRAAALERGRSESTLDLHDEAMMPIELARCPVCLCVNPCAKHGRAAQQRVFSEYAAEARRCADERPQGESDLVEVRHTQLSERVTLHEVVPRGGLVRPSRPFVVGERPCELRVGRHDRAGAVPVVGFRGESFRLEPGGVGRDGGYYERRDYGSGCDEFPMAKSCGRGELDK